MKIRGYWLIASRFVIHSLQHDMPNDFWGWLYTRVADRQSRDYGNKILVWLLFVDALKEKEHLRAVAIYEKFKPMIDKSLGAKYEPLLRESMQFARDHESRETTS